MTDAGAADADLAAVAHRYDRFAREEAPGRSALYESWAAGVARDRRAQAVLAQIPATRRQPPLVFAIARMAGAPDAPYADFAAWLYAHADEFVAAASARSLQTNEPQRCTALLPALAGIDGPIALVELGAAAGLCLVPDRYAYRYRGAGDEVRLAAPGQHTGVTLDCVVRGRMPPIERPRIVWRRGVDLTPLSARDPQDAAFLRALVWPGETGRAERIAAALDVVAADPPEIHAGDVTDVAVLRRATQDAPADATLVVTTPGLAGHLSRAGRSSLRAGIAAVGARWISIDAPDAGSPADDGFIVRRDDDEIARCDPLGAWLEWRHGAGAARR
ncbi:DUF2332 domain-containing protein [Microbacterium sp. LRZ72]|uniref:DUF2332 domain-containing protein n=1 Tax=Microbacterium sp. LRZ72 TaxID=2942481 RepID=UPI0029AD22BC|nr:DUF2332 domain-containing protein [Microbacterium sp. LRZ72]MDX2375940.1 DUF2332 domain-containing protein [Microbacterium sp. LRZ72]